MSSAGLLFKFHLDGPIKQPCDSPIRMWGWIAAHAPIRNVILIGAARLNLFLAARPDVFAAHPEFAFAIGFVGGVNEEDLVNGTLIFEFQVGDRTFSQTQALPPNAEPAPYIAEKPPSFLESLRSFTKRSENDWYAIQGRFLSKTKVGPSHSINRLQLEEFAELFLNAFPEAVVLQIGASDGRSLWTKLLERTHWKGVLVEPIPHLADVLEKRFKEKDNVSIENSAIVEDDGVTRLYRPGVEPGRIPLWYQRLATVDRNILSGKTAMIPDIEERIVEQTVSAMGVKSLLAKYGLSRADLLVVDTSGHEDRILNQFRFREFQPWVIHYDHSNWTEAERTSMRTRLDDCSYTSITTESGGVLALRRESD